MQSSGNSAGGPEGGGWSTAGKRRNQRSGGGRGGGRRGEGSSGGRGGRGRGGKRPALAVGISEEVRLAITNALSHFRDESADEFLKFPHTLTPQERKFIHDQCAQLGLISKSFGSKQARQLRVSRHAASNNKQLSVPRISLPRTVQEQIALTADKPVLPVTVDDMRWLLTGESRTKHHKSHHQHRQPKAIDAAAFESALQSRSASHKGQRMLAARQRLPAWSVREQVVHAAANSRVLVISGDTGCGKSTQVPQFILDDLQSGPSANILVSQPRRISAVSLADRVADERCERVGQSVGYAVRLDKQSSSNTRLLFCTTGVLLRRLTADPLLTGVSHVVLDEVHERSCESDFLLMILKRVLPKRADLTVVVMSATLQLALFKRFFEDVPMHKDDQRTPIAVVHIPGAVHSVAEYYLEDVLLHTGYLGSMDVSVGKKAAVSQVQQAAVDSLRKQGVQVPDGMEGVDFSKLFPEHDTVSTSVLSADIQDRGVGAPPAGALQSIKAAGRGEEAIAVHADMSCEQCGNLFEVLDDFTMHVAMCMGPGTVDDMFPQGVPPSADQAAAAGAAAPPAPEANTEAFFDPVVAPPSITAATAPEVPSEDDSSRLGSLLETIASATKDRQRDGKGRLKAGAAEAAIQNTMQEGDAVGALLQQYQSLVSDEDVDCDLVVVLIEAIVRSQRSGTGVAGAILVFLPGWDEISRVMDAVHANAFLRTTDSTWVLPLHSAIPTHEQKQVFQAAPAGQTKVVLSTNLAETSITIDDVVYVIDAGKGKQKLFDPYTGCSTLQTRWVSQASARQRAGRAGRVQPGIAYHLFSRQRHSSLLKHDVAEMLCTPLEELCLRVKALKLDRLGKHTGAHAKAAETVAAAGAAEAAALGGDLGVGEIELFMASAPEPPKPLSVRRAVELLRDIGALSVTPGSTPGSAVQLLTPLGHALLNMPIAPQMGKTILMAIMLGVLHPVLTIACTMAYRPPFALPTKASQRPAADSARARFAAGSGSDQMAMLGAYNGFKAAHRSGGMGNAKAFCRDNFLSFPTLLMIDGMRQQVLQELTASGVLAKEETHYKAFPNRNEKHFAVVQAALAVGLYPQIARWTPAQGGGGKQVYVDIDATDRAVFHRSSLLWKTVPGLVQQATRDSSTHALYFAYEELARVGRNNSLRSAAAVPELALLTLCGADSISPGKSKMQAMQPDCEGMLFVNTADFVARKCSAAAVQDELLMVAQQTAAQESSEDESSDEDDDLSDADEEAAIEGRGGGEVPAAKASKHRKSGARVMAKRLVLAARAKKRELKQVHVAHAATEAEEWNATAGAGVRALMSGGGEGAAAAVAQDGTVIASIAPVADEAPDDERPWTPTQSRKRERSDDDVLPPSTWSIAIHAAEVSMGATSCILVDDWIAVQAPLHVSLGIAAMRVQLAKAFGDLVLSRFHDSSRHQGPDQQRAADFVDLFVRNLVGSHRPGQASSFDAPQASASPYSVASHPSSSNSRGRGRGGGAWRSPGGSEHDQGGGRRGRRGGGRGRGGRGGGRGRGGGGRGRGGGGRGRGGGGQTERS